MNYNRHQTVFVFLRLEKLFPTADTRPGVGLMATTFLLNICGRSKSKIISIFQEFETGY